MSKLVVSKGRRIVAGLALSLAAFGLTACGGSDDDKYVEQPVERLYNRGLDALGEQVY